jgi:hypothetical protein
VRTYKSHTKSRVLKTLDAVLSREKVDVAASSIYCKQIEMVSAGDSMNCNNGKQRSRNLQLKNLSFCFGKKTDRLLERAHVSGSVEVVCVRGSTKHQCNRDH